MIRIRQKFNSKICALIITAIMLLSVSVIYLHASAENDSLEMNEKNEFVFLLQSNLINDNLDVAKEYLERIYQIEGDSSFYALSYARIKMMYGNYDEAYLLYKKAEMLDTDKKLSITKEEQDFYTNIRDGNRLTPTKTYEYTVMAEYIEGQGLNPEDYGYEKGKFISVEETEKEIEQVKEAIIDSTKQELQDLVKNDEKAIEMLFDALELVGIVEEEYSTYQKSNYYDEEVLKNAVYDLSRVYRKAPALFNMDEIDEAYIKGLTLLEEYKDLVDYAEKSNSQFALSMVANLYISDEIVNKDFSDDFIGNSKEEYSAVIDQCEEAMSELKDKDIDEDVLDELDSIVERLEVSRKNPVLAELDGRIRPETTEKEKQSKIHLQKTNVNYEIGDNFKANESFQAALDTAIYSDDLSYVKPMTELVNIVNSKSDSEEIKNTSDYLSEAYQNSLPIKTDTHSSISDTFAQKASEYISTKKAMINIGHINTSSFPQITATVQLSSNIDINNPQLTIMDCHSKISDFKIEKQVFNKMMVYLVCDISGSMDGSEEQLQEAVRQFMSSISSNEEVSLLGFSSGVEFDSGFTSDSAELEPYIEMLNPGGGTDIGNATYYSIDQLLADNNTSNIIILMTDGNDNSFNHESQLLDLKRRCEEKNILLYTIGLGESISVQYLENIASYGNGRFVYSGDAVSLQSLYDFIHQQIDNNYLITFEAKNTVDNIRELEIINQADGSSSSKTYRLSYEEDSEDTYSDDVEEVWDAEDGIYASGVDTPTIFMGDTASSNFNILGKGFLNGKDVNVSLEGSMNYNSLDAKVIDDGHINVVVDNVQMGTYTVVARIDNQVFSFEDAITVVKSDGEQTLKFGAYRFDAAMISYNGDECLLRGNVVMNDYINFNGDVILRGDLESLQVEFTDLNGSYINFKKGLPGILNVFFGNTMYLPPMGTFTLYNDQAHIYDLDDYTTEQFGLPNLFYSALTFENPYIALYPHKIEFTFGELDFDFPFQKDIMKYKGVENPFTVSGSSKAIINADTLGAVGEFSASKKKGIKFTVLTFHLSDLEFEFNTLSHDYKLEMAVSTKELIPKVGRFGEADSADYGFDIALKGGKWDEFNINLDIPVTVVATPPISISDFKLGVSGMSTANQGKGFLNTLGNATFSGGCDISVLKLADFIKGIDKILGDASLVTLDDTTASIRFNKFMLQFKTKLKLFGEIEMGEAQFDLGHYDYSNYLLNISESEVAGLRFINTRGFDWDIKNFKIKMQGSTTFTINKLFSGLWANGLVDYDIKALGRHKNVIDGDVLVGAHNEFTQFTIILKTSDLKANKEDGVKLTFTKGKWLPDVKFY